MVKNNNSSSNVDDALHKIKMIMNKVNTKSIEELGAVKPNIKPIKGGAKSEVRTFKICEINGKNVIHTGRYKSKTTPQNAAKKALKRICNDMNIKNKKCEVMFSIQEVTRGSNKKIFGPYEGIKKLLKTPKKVYDKNKKLLYTVEYESNVSLATNTK